MAAYHYFVTGDQPKVRAAYERLLELDPNDTWALNNLGLSYSLMGDGAKALDLAERTNRIEESAFHRTNIVSAQVLLGRIPDALATIEESETRYPDVPGLVRLHASVQAAGRDFAGAEVTTRRYLDMVRGNPLRTVDGHGNLAEIAIIRGQLHKAEQNTQEAVRGARELGRPSWELGLQMTMAITELMLAEDPDRALARIDRALESVPLDSLPELERPYGSLVFINALTNRPDEARAQLAGCEAQLPSQGILGRTWIHMNRGIVLLGAGKPDDAQVEFQQIDNGTPFAQTFQQLMMGWAYELAGEPDSAVVAYQRYLDRPQLARLDLDTPAYPFTLEHLAKLYDRMGDRTRAVEYYRRFTDLWADADPEFQPRVDAARKRITELLQPG